MSQEFLDKPVRITDLVPEEGMLRDFHFTRCRIGGPAVLWLEDDTVQMLGCTYGNLFGDAKPESLWWDAPSEWTAGAVFVSNCTFLQCDFLMVGFTGTPEKKRRYLAAFKDASGA
jgi:hypothetical protein